MKLLSTTAESRENRKPVEESSNGECKASLEQSTKVNWCEGFLIPAEFSEVIDHCLRKGKPDWGSDLCQY